MEYTFDLGQILTDEECNVLSGKIIEAYTSNKLMAETDIKYYKNSYGGNIDENWELCNRFLPLVEEKTGLKLKVANPYCRIYNNESTLNTHIDRAGLDWTISICLFTNIGYDWPLEVKVTHWDIEKFPTKTGFASLVNGGVLEHWREPLQCDDEHYVIQLFLHYTEIK